MATAFKTVLDAITAALAQAPAVAGGRIHAGRDRPLPEEHASDVALDGDSADGEQFALTAGPVNWRMTVPLQLRARGSSTTHARDAVDALLEAAFARLAATAPPAGVSGWVLSTRYRCDFDEAAQPVAVMQLAVTVELRTAPGSLALHA